MDKQTYVAAEGVDLVNGRPVPKNREIVLTTPEALYDLSLGRIDIKVKARASAKPSRKVPSVPDTPVNAAELDQGEA
ncbi:hypothetical protein [uncultured Hoeflea sp.]|uniref:hypothetical protein n=1 Tax=uncultured Hoeflea sp. TaxID=538666 RepID=UPI0030DB47FE|tara:strand:+ start:1348 stop:1578 length:231 start_codon:yes stop_codon:yes gene_type:complete